mgnify:CR=1 FL=1
MEHKHQTKRYTCGSTAYAMLLGIDEKTAYKECKTRATGTSTRNVTEALTKRGIQFKVIPIQNDFHAVIHDLERISRDYPFYMSSIYKSRYSTKGRDQVRRHAAAVSNGFIYDPSEPFECDIFSYEHVFNKQLIIKEIIVLLNYPIN